MPRKIGVEIEAERKMSASRAFVVAFYIYAGVIIAIAGIAVFLMYVPVRIQHFTVGSIVGAILFCFVWMGVYSNGNDDSSGGGCV